MVNFVMAHAQANGEVEEEQEQGRHEHSPDDGRDHAYGPPEERRPIPSDPCDGFVDGIRAEARHVA
jgi:hypothetical protein